MAPLLMMGWLLGRLVQGWLLEKLVQGWETALVHWLACHPVLSADPLHSGRFAGVALLQGFVAWWSWALCFDLGMVVVTWFSFWCA